MAPALNETTMTKTSSPDVAGWTRAELEAAFRKVGLRSGDTVYFQVCAEPLGVALDASTHEELCGLLHGALRSAVGESGTILAPAFTFSFCRQQPFDVAETPTVRGPWNTFAEFPEYLRRLPGAVRSADPIFSTAGEGPRAAELLSELPPVCLGEDSVHDRLRRAGGKICILGVGLYEAIFRHHAECMSQVPWRYDKLFTGYVIANGERRKQGWLYNVRINAGNGDPAGERLESMTRSAGLCKVADVGSGELVAVEAQQYFDHVMTELRKDPWLSAKGPSGDPVAIEAERVGASEPVVDLPPRASMKQMMDGLWRVRRDVVSEGYDAALRALAEQLPMTIHEYPTGSHCWTWIVPEKWSCQEAYLETIDGRRIFSYADHPLHVVSHSLAYDGVVMREELFAHLHVHPTLPDAVPFIFKYYDRDWGLCCTREQRDALTDERYRVVIRTSFSYGTLKVGEVVIPGESEECIVLCAHLCHPAMANDDLSGVVVGVEVARALLAREKRRYTYRLVLVPETIGTVAYLSHNEALIPHMKGGLFLEMLGKEHPHSLQRSFIPDSEMDECLMIALGKNDPEGWSAPFGTIIGNDERQYNSPGVRVPMLSLSRVLPSTHPEYPYREYHSSHDTPEVLAESSLEGSRDMVLAMIDTLEDNRVPVNDFKGEVFCARYGIHVDWYTNPEGHRALFHVMYQIDGTNTIAEIARRCGIPFHAAKLTIDELRRHGLVHYR